MLVLPRATEGRRPFPTTHFPVVRPTAWGIPQSGAEGDGGGLIPVLLVGETHRRHRGLGEHGGPGGSGSHQAPGPGAQRSTRDRGAERPAVNGRGERRRARYRLRQSPVTGKHCDRAANLDLATRVALQASRLPLRLSGPRRRGCAGLRDAAAGSPEPLRPPRRRAARTRCRCRGGGEAGALRPRTRDAKRSHIPRRRARVAWATGLGGSPPAGPPRGAAETKALPSRAEDGGARPAEAARVARTGTGTGWAGRHAVLGAAGLQRSRPLTTASPTDAVPGGGVALGTESSPCR